MNVLYLTHFFPPELNGGARRVDDLSTLWSSMGADVTVLTGFPSHPTGIVPERYRGLWSAEEHRNGVRVIRAKKYSVPNRGFLKRVMNHLSLAISASALAVAKRLRPDVVVCTSPPLLIGISGLLLSRALRVPLVFEVRDLWPDQAIQLGMLRNPLLIALARGLERACYRGAAAVVVVTNAARKGLIERGIPAEKVFVVRNGVQIERSAVARAPISLRDAPGQLVVSYFGTMGLSQGLTTLLDAASLLRDRGVNDVRLVLMGDGVERQALIDGAAARTLDNLAILPPCPFEEIDAYYAASDVAIIILRDLPLFRDTIPSKVYEIMASGIPVIAMIQGEAREIVDSAGAGVTVEPESVTGLVDAIERLRSMDAGGRAALGEAGRRWVAVNCAREAQARDYLHILRAVREVGRSALNPDS